MHTRGRSIDLSLDQSTLLDIPRWDFHWQQPYFFEQPVPVNAGQTAKVSCTFDNPTDATLRFGEKTTDEMCLSYFYVTSN